MKWEGKVGTLQRCESQEGGGHSSLHLSASGGMSMLLAALEALSHFPPWPELAEHQWVAQGSSRLYTPETLVSLHLPPAPIPWSLPSSTSPSLCVAFGMFQNPQDLIIFSLLPLSWVISSVLWLQCICVLIPPVRIILTLKKFLRGNLY